MFIVPCYLTDLIASSHSAAPLPDHLPFYLATINYVIKTDLKLNSLLFHFIIHVFMPLSKRNKRFLLTLLCCIRFASTQIGADHAENSIQLPTLCEWA